MSAFVSEIIGTAILLLLGNGVVANALLKGSKAFGSGWIVITFGWGIAVFMAVFIVGPYSGAHINPAVTIGLAAAGKFDWAQVPAYILAQMIGALTGSSLVWVHYRLHYRDTVDPGTILATFSTGPAIRSTIDNLVSEVIGTFVLVFAVLYITGPSIGGEPGSLGSLDALPVALVVLGIGLSLGGPTGYAINPARDLGPRIAHALLPIANKGKSDWSYAWIPVVGPVTGGALAAVVFNVLQ